MKRRHRLGARRRGMRGRLAVSGVLLAALVVSACGSGTSSPKATPSTAPPGSTLPVVKTLGPGVTASTINVGISLVDFKPIECCTDSLRFGQEAIYQAFIDDINQHGGIAGRKIKPFYKEYLSVGSAALLAVCTSFADDDNVFATMGTYYDPSGDSQLCMTKDHHRVLLTFDLTQAMIDKAPPGLLVTPATTPERSVEELISQLKKEGKLDNKTVAVLGDTNVASTVNGTIIPTLKKVGVPTVKPALLDISGTDTTAAESALDSFIERWKTEHVNAVFLSSYEASSPRFVTKLRDGLPNVALFSDNSQVLSYGQQLRHSHIEPNAYQGLITSYGPTHKEYEQSANWKYCADIYKQQTGKTAPGPDAVIPYKGSATKTLDTYGAINDACQLVTMFRDIGNKVGHYLNNDNWINTVNTFGHIENKGTGPYSSLHAGKYDADDNFRLVEFDETLPPDGNWKPLTPIQNVTGSS